MISVCMATYNGEKYIWEQIYSILSQLGNDDELIISDDASTDRTYDIVCSFNDNRIKFYTFKRNKTKYQKNIHLVTTNFENALSKANGEYIFLADQDDIWLPNKIDVCMKYLVNTMLVVHDCFIVDEQLNILKPSFFIHRKVRPGFLKNLYKSSYLGCCMAFKKELLKKCLPIPYNVGHDIWISLINELFYSSFCIPDKLLLYRRHNGNVTSSGGASKNCVFSKALYRFFIIKNIIKKMVLK